MPDFDSLTDKSAPGVVAEGPDRWRHVAALRGDPAPVVA